MFKRYLSVLAIAASVEVGLASDNAEFPAIRIQDETGKAVAGAKAAVRKQEHIANFIDGWYAADGAGLIKINPDRAKGDWDNAVARGTYHLLVKAPGLAPTIATVDVPSTLTELVVNMDRGREIEFAVKPYTGSRLPASLVPTMVDSRVLTTTLRSFSPDDELNHSGKPLDLFEVKKSGGTRFTVRVPSNFDSSVAFVINEPDYMRNYVSPLYPAEELLSGNITLELPEPVSVKLNFNSRKTTATDVYQVEELKAGLWQEGGIPVITTATKAILANLDNLAPGTYYVSGAGVHTDVPSNREDFPSYLKPHIYFYDDQITLAAGETTTVIHQYPLLPKDYFKGDGSLTMTLKSATGRSLAGQPYWILASTENYLNLVIREGRVPESSVITEEGLGRNEMRYYEIVVGKEHSSIFTFKKDAHVSATRYIAPAKGDIAPELEAWDVETSEKLSLKSLNGKVVLLEFWATWCGPCQPSMQKLEDGAKALPAELADQVEIIAVSVDEDVPEVTERLKEKGWGKGKVRNYWYGPGAPSARGGPYGISSIPRAVLIGKDGRIVDPQFHISDDLEKRLQDHIK